MIIRFLAALFLTCLVTTAGAESFPTGEDEGVQGAALDVSQAIAQFHRVPDMTTLQGLHLACRDLKSQLTRYRSYFGTAATHGLKGSVLPAIDGALSALNARRDTPALDTKRVQLARQAAEVCRQVLVAERMR